MEVDDDEAVIPVESGDEGGQIVICDVGPKLTVQLVDCLGREWMIIDGLDGGADLIRDEEVPFTMTQVILKALVGAVAGAPAGAELPGLEVLPLVFNDFRGSRDERVMIGAAR